MKYESIDDIYASNASIRDRLKQLVSGLPDESASTLPDGEKWTIAQIVEHLTMVDEGTTRICSRLLKKAQEENDKGYQGVDISDGFRTKSREIAAMKVEAPAIVQPSGTRSIADSIGKLDENSERCNELLPLFKSVDGTALKFPHPFFGDISAQEWLALKGGHELRHIKQIERILSRLK